MEFPTELRYALEQILAGQKQNVLAMQAQSLSERYRFQTGSGHRLLTEDVQAAAYAAVRMPATFGAVCKVLEETLRCTDIHPSTLLDVGAGTGSASFAAAEFLSLNRVICLEREGAMSRLGKRLMQQAGSNCLKQAVWKDCDLVQKPALDRADLVIASYVLGEMNPSDRKIVAGNLWEATGQMLLIVEPGTPAGFAQLKDLRSLLLSRGAHLAAPCPSGQACPIPEGDWCHFTCRIARSKLHRQLKGADAPYEDEKFCYLALTKKPSRPAPARIRRHPRIEPGKITLELCTKTGFRQAVLRKRDGSLFKQARKSSCGDQWDG